MPNLPGPATTKRVRLWRRLQGVGAIAVRPAVYVLPAREDCIETFQWVAREIAEMGGQASLCEGQFVDGVTDGDIERKFIEARNSDYATLGKEARELEKGLKAKRSTTGLEALELQFSKLKQRFEEIVSVDFCHASGREGAEGFIGAIERTLAEKRGPERKPDR
ncbi:MAG TPA: Chromate resistance protein ChrB, partial [Polyangiaceae bacterium]